MKAKRFLAWVVAAMMLLSSLALPSYLGGAQEAEALSLEVPEVPTLASSKTPIAKDDPDVTETSGKCGNNLYWNFDPYSGALVITGSGEMWPWDSYYSWRDYDYADQVLSITLPKGLINIGEEAFGDCTALKEITLPSTVKRIDYAAFENCTSLQSITLPKSLTSISSFAFSGCSALKHVYFGGTAADGVKIAIGWDNNELIHATWHYSKPNTTALAIKVHPKNTRVNEGKTATFKVKAAGAQVIQWQYRGPNDSYWYDWGLTGESITVPGSYDYDGYQFRAAASNGSTTVYSKAATLTVKLVTLAIKTQPKKLIKVNVGKSFTVKVNAVGANHYTWWYKWADETYWSEYESDSNTFTRNCSYASWYDGMLVYCVVSNDRGDEIVSDTATISVNVAITKQPKSVTVYEGEYAIFTIAGSGYCGDPFGDDDEDTGIQWEYQWPRSKNWYVLGGGYEDTIYIPAYSDYNGLKFRCRLYNNSQYKYSSTVKMTVKKEAPNPKGANRALLVGENWYSGSPLYGCMNDMYAMEGMLKGLKNKFSTKILPNSSKSQIINAIRNSFKGATSNSVSLFYYSGHGSTDYNGSICALDYYISFNELAYELAQVKGRVIVILDSCFSGAAIDKAAGSDNYLKAYNQAAINAFSGYYMAEDGSTTKEKTMKSGELAQGKFIVITASSQTETSHDYYFDGSGYRQGQFTAALVQGMGCYYPKGAYRGYMPADYDGNQQITLGEIYDYAYTTALDWEDTQHAQYYGNLNTVLFRRK